MKKVLFFAILALSAMMVSCNKPAAQSEQKDEIQSPVSTEMDAFCTAAELAKYGYRVGSPSALIEAADIFASIPIQMEEDSLGADIFNPAKLIADARELTDDVHLLALADKVAAKLNASAEVARGAMGAPGCQPRPYRISAHECMIFDQTFNADRMAEVCLVGDGDTDLDLYVYDEDDNLLASDVGPTDRCYVRFQPAKTALYRIKIVNLGGVYNNCCLATNN